MVGGGPRSGFQCEMVAGWLASAVGASGGYLGAIEELRTTIQMGGWGAFKRKGIKKKALMG